MQLDEVEVHIGGDPLKLFADGRADVVPIEDPVQLPGSRVERVDEGCVLSLVFNPRDPELADRRRAR